MKKSFIASLFVYTLVIVGLLVYHLLSLFDLTGSGSWGQVLFWEKFLLFVLLVTLAFSFFILISLKLTQEMEQRRFSKLVRQLLKGEAPAQTGGLDLDRDLAKLSSQLQQLTASVQQSENQALEEREKTIETERKRIARDLHDTVSQELFAASMILSGLKSQAAILEPAQLEQQLAGVTDILETAQKDLRVLLLHLRPQELEGRTLVEGLSVILAEVRDKSAIQVLFEHEVKDLPQQVEEHIFRIAQEVVSNTLRHAQAQHLSVYLLQREHELQLKMVDDGQGFDPAQLDELSYGMANIRERVADMAGSLKILTAPRQGVSIDIRVPLLDAR